MQKYKVSLTFWMYMKKNLSCQVIMYTNSKYKLYESFNLPSNQIVFCLEKLSTSE